MADVNEGNDVPPNGEVNPPGGELPPDGEENPQMAVLNGDGPRLPVIHIQPPQALQLGDNPRENWRLWKDMWENYCTISDLNSPHRTNQFKRAVLLSTVGKEAYRLYNNNDPAEADTMQQIIAKLDTAILGLTNETFERYQFNTRFQGDESADDFIAALKVMRKTCNFCNCMSDSLLRDRIICGIRDNETRKQLLNERNLTLEKCMDTVRTQEKSQAQLQQMGRGIEHINQMDTKSKRQSTKKAKCKFCGRAHLMKKEHCPAWGKTCNKCQGPNHFAIQCEKLKSGGNAKVDCVEVDSDTESVNTVHTINSSLLYAEMLVNGKNIRFQVDTGASTNIIPENHVQPDRIHSSEVHLKMWNGTLVKALGTTQLLVRNGRRRYKVDFVVAPNGMCPLLGRKTVECMGLVTINYQRIHAIVPAGGEQDALSNILSSPRFKSVFDGKLGKLEGEVSFHVKEDVIPVVSRPRRVPVSLEEKVKAELHAMCEKGVLAPAQEPSKWISQMAVANHSSGDIRICIDPRPLNTALIRSHYTLPTVDEILPKLSKARVVSKLDVKKAFWHCVLSERASKYTTMATPYGLYRWLRLPYGTSVSSEEFQKALAQALDGIDGIVCVADDILLYGVGETMSAAVEDHNRKMECLLERCIEKKLKLNRDKCEFLKTEVAFLGHIITSNGLKVDPKKVEAIVSMRKPEGVADIQRINGCVNYLSRFLPNLSDVMAPIMKLTRKAQPWEWTQEQERAFDKMKSLVTNTPVLAYYDSSKPITVQCDSSQSGLGAVLMQEGKPIAYASRALRDSETRYAQIEKELLAIVWSLERFDQYTFGQTVFVESDHKPIENLMGKPLEKIPRRLQGMMLRLLRYNPTVVYVPGKNLHLADTLSRHYLQTDTSGQSEFEQVHGVLDDLAIGPNRIEAMRRETLKDETLQKLTRTVTMGWPEHSANLESCLKPYFSFRDELTSHEGLLFKGDRLIVPSSLRAEMKDYVHSAHLGIDACLTRARELFFWPGMTGEIRQHVSICETCQSYGQSQMKETLQSHDVPMRPYERVGVDIMAFEGQDYLVTVDFYSNFFEVDKLPTSTSGMVIQKLRPHFARYGIPQHVMTDGGPQFSSKEFARFAERYDFQHTMSDPYYPKSNGKVESAVKRAKSLMKKSSHFYLALLESRNTPSQGLPSPAQRLLGRRTRTLAPTRASLLQPPERRDVDSERSKMRANQEAQERYYNRNAKDLPPLSEGTAVRIQPVGPSDTWQKGTVVGHDRDRSYVVRTENGTQYRRNRVHLRKVPQAQSSPSITPQPGRLPGTATPKPQGLPAVRPTRIRRRPKRLDDYFLEE